MPGVNPNFIFYKLNMDPLLQPKKQKSRRYEKQHMGAMKEEVEKPKQAGAIRELFFPEWLSNMVIVKKKNGKWRVCVDFTDLNRACPKDYFPVLKIN